LLHTSKKLKTCTIQIQDEKNFFENNPIAKMFSPFGVRTENSSLSIFQNLRSFFLEEWTQ